MFLNLKPLLVVLAMALFVFALAKPVCLSFMSRQDYNRRRAVWFVLTITAFVSPTFWIYVAVALPLMMWAAHRDQSPLALYLLLFFVIPPVQIEIPTIGINRLFALDQVRLMGFAILVPFAWARLRRHASEPRIEGFPRVADALLIALGIWQVVLLIPYEAPTNTMRRAFLYFLDTYLVFYTFSRLAAPRRDLRDLMAMVCVSAVLFALIAVFESNREWLLYTGVPEVWDSANRDAWLLRGDALRAQAATGHAITLGYVIAMALGFWLYLKAEPVPRPLNLAVLTILLAGLFYTLSRGPWLTAAILALVFLALGARNVGGLAKSMLAVGVLVALIVATPFGQTVIQNLPFVGSAAQETVNYRQQLAETSWALIQQNPWLGNPFVMLEMEELRGGTGIVDMVNAYAGMALFYGLPALGMYVAAFLLCMAGAFVTLKAGRASGDRDAVLLTAALIACLLSTLIFMATAGNAWLQWLLLGMVASSSRISLQPQTPTAESDLRAGRRFGPTRYGSAV